MEGSGGGCSERWRRVRRLMNDSLVPLSTVTESSAILPKETEKDLLLTLTSVFREVRQWARQVEDLHPDQVEVESPALGGEFCSPCDGASWGGCDCLEDIAALLISFLKVKNLYVQLLAGKILVEIFNLLIESGDSWKEFLHLLWTSFEASFHMIALTSKSSRSENVANGGPMPTSQFIDSAEITKKIACSTVNPISSFHQNLVEDNHSMIIPLVKVLRDIVKCIKIKRSDLLKRCMELAITSLSALPWSSLRSDNDDQIVGGIYSGQVESSPLSEKIRLAKSDPMFLGTLLQLLCSMVDQKNLEEDTSVDDFSVYPRLMNLVQKILSFCFCKDTKYNSIGILQYLRHKALMLMIRLSFGAHWKCSFVMSWLELLREHFVDLLYRPISKYHNKTDHALEGSPFRAGLNDEEKVDNMCSCHLQRLANFLFLKCCFASSHFNSESAAGHVHWTEYRDEFARELNKWLTKHVSGNKVVECENRSLLCNNFSLSLLQLYLDEDDMLFELLLLLLDSAYLNVQEENHEYSTLLFVDMRSDIAPQLSSIFNPVHLFHFFLFLLCYDHMVLLDYLISKDTGIQCLRYLMRCLHSVCRSWSIFVNFSVREFDNRLLDSQERTASVVGKDGSVCLSSLKNDSSNCVLIEKKNKKLGNLGRKRRKTGPQTFENAKNCLLSLKTLIEDLYRKNLFPYNPTVLLKSFSRFQELCQNVN